MSRGAETYRVTAITAAVLGALCLPCVLGPWLLAVGLSSVLLAVGMWFTPALLGMIGISAVGFALSWRGHRNPLPLVLALAAGGAIYTAGYVVYSRPLTFVAAALLTAAAGLDWLARRRTAACSVRPSDAASRT